MTCYVKRIAKSANFSKRVKASELFFFIDYFQKCLLDDQAVSCLEDMTRKVVASLNRQYPSADEWVVVRTGKEEFKVVSLFGMTAEPNRKNTVLTVVTERVAAQRTNLDVDFWAQKFIDRKGGEL